MDDSISEILPIYLLQHLDLEEYPPVNHPLTGPQFSARQQFNQTVFSYSFEPNREISTKQLKDFHKTQAQLQKSTTHKNPVSSSTQETEIKPHFIPPSLKQHKVKKKTLNFTMQ